MSIGRRNIQKNDYPLGADQVLGLKRSLAATFAKLVKTYVDLVIVQHIVFDCYYELGSMGGTGSSGVDTMEEVCVSVELTF